MAPHTSWWDGILGRYLVWKMGIKGCKFLSKRSFFNNPLISWAFRLWGCVPISPRWAIKYLKEGGNRNVVICPEGTLEATDKWYSGFWFIANEAEVPIVYAYLDYAKKEAGIAKIVWPSWGKDKAMEELVTVYSGVTACHPEKFKLPKNETRSSNWKAILQPSSKSSSTNS